MTHCADTVSKVHFTCFVHFYGNQMRPSCVQIQSVTKGHPGSAVTLELTLRALPFQVPVNKELIEINRRRKTPLKRHGWWWWGVRLRWMTRFACILRTKA